MSDMTILFKEEFKRYETSIYHNFNNIENKKEVNDDDFFSKQVDMFVPKQGVFKYSNTETSEESFVKNYVNPFAAPKMLKKTIVVEQNESKIALKLYTYTSTRGEGKKYFKVRRVIDYLTFNFKRKLFYSGTLNLKKKKKIGGVMCINKTDIASIDVIRKISFFDENNESNKDKRVTNCLNIFLNTIIDRLELNIKDENNIRKKYYEVILKISGVKYPNAFEKFASYYTPKKEIQKFGNNLVTWFMKKHNLKGTKIRNILNMYENIDIDTILNLYNIFGIDLFNKIENKSLLTRTNQSIYVNGWWGNDSLYDKLSKSEKENIIKIINTTSASEVLNSLNDHVLFKEQLKKYGEYVKISAKTYNEYVTEHSEWSSLLQSYKTGDVTRYYGEDAKLIEKPINFDGNTYYPVLLTKTGEYEMESSHQSNCVRTYSEKPHCLIISLRKGDKNGLERATIEFQFRKNQLVIVQKLGRFNKSLSPEWSAPINELNEFANYLYSKEIIKLPKMTKTYRNGKTIVTTAKFDNDDKILHLVPVWDNEEQDNNYLLDHIAGYDFYDELP
jgi:hypothetical protein